MDHHRTALAFLFCAIACAAPAEKEEPATIKVSGSSGLVAFKPDEARVSLEITTAGETPSAAEGENSKCREAVIDGIRKELSAAVGTHSMIEVTGYTIAPSYKSTPSELFGYIVQSAIRLTTEDFSTLGMLSELARRNKGRLAEVEYSLKNDQLALASVVRKATQIARSNAESIAAALGQKVLSIRSVESAPGRYGPLSKADLSPRPTPSVTIMPGRNAALDDSIRFEATVTLIVEIGRQ